MGKVPSCFATIDSELLLKTEDEVLRKFFGQNTQDMFISFIDCIHSEDEEVFRSAVEEMKAKSMPKNVVMVRLVNSDKEYCWAVITVSFNPLTTGSENIYNLQIVDPDDDSAQQLEDSKNEYSAFLDLMNGILFSYEIDTKQICIFMRSGGQQLTLFSGSLEKWKEEMLGGKLDKESESAFSSICRDLEMKRSSFSYHIRTSGFSNDNKMEQCVFKAQLVAEHNGE